MFSAPNTSEPPRRMVGSLSAGFSYASASSADMSSIGTSSIGTPSSSANMRVTRVKCELLRPMICTVLMRKP